MFSEDSGRSMPPQLFALCSLPCLPGLPHPFCGPQHYPSSVQNWEGREGGRTPSWARHEIGSQIAMEVLDDKLILNMITCAIKPTSAFVQAFQSTCLTSQLLRVYWHYIFPLTKILSCFAVCCEVLLYLAAVLPCLLGCPRKVVGFLGPDGSTIGPLPLAQSRW